MVQNGIIPGVLHAEADPHTSPCPKVAKLSFRFESWSDKMGNVLKRIYKQFSDFIGFFRLTTF